MANLPKELTPVIDAAITQMMRGSSNKKTRIELMVRSLASGAGVLDEVGACVVIRTAINMVDMIDAGLDEDGNIINDALAKRKTESPGELHEPLEQGDPSIELGP